ncbi:hypothetical protein U0C82_06870 [Fulvimarina sp. 2208YS6-2-32]|uniref:Uncharacterized protein n=1 Tax=Fulvimarina uroteuthidis TaxID=3098149 RepID=A0ABU5I0X3_9HYPH|nr:hypothetical protein [Fulvimarina sp. 2208YS6-2-32]
MKLTIIATLLGLGTSPATAQICIYPALTPIQTGKQILYQFTDSCGQAYEVGYRLEGNTLHFPSGGQHTLPERSDEDAERVLREAYGLIGKPESLIRTKW